MGGRKAGPGNQGYTRYSLEGLGRVSDAYGGMSCKWNDWGFGSWSLSQDIFGKERHAPYFEERIRGTTEISAGLIAAQAVSSLQIAEDAHAESILINRMLRR
ncbi:hypothetical protein IFM89_024663 [Coptis chinensis]|uniref:Uncharacterized protein n=1 Tax=Coptis chinensis TaxID=261450 RepID=A0A835IER2_9MAGN|nr:hypothetical protein IFM89_024663 [Coptis chinensis]